MQSTIHPFPIYSTIPEQQNGSRSILIGTHSGSFHCDEALAIAMLSLLPEEQGFPHDRTIVIRTRDLSILNQCDILVDVGAEYDAEKRKFDHHQKSFDELKRGEKTLNEKYETKLSSSGLIYKHFGRDILKHLVSCMQQQPEESSSLSLDVLEDIYDRVYKNFMEHIDANDNGIEVCDGEVKYKITTTLPARVARLNTKWNSPKEQQMSEYENSQFQKAVIMTGEAFLDVVNGYLEQWLPARSIVWDAINNRKLVDPSGRIIKFERSCPWMEHLFAIEKQLHMVVDDQIQLAIFESGDSWRVQSVPIEGKSFENRCPLPSEWRGLRDQELSDKAGIDGCVFVHMSGFIGGNKTYEGALAMARDALHFASNGGNGEEAPASKKQKVN